MKKFIDIYFGFFITLPLLFCVLLYALYAFITWSFPNPNIDWFLVRLYLIITFLLSFIFSLDE